MWVWPPCFSLRALPRPLALSCSPGEQGPVDNRDIVGPRKLGPGGMWEVSQLSWSSLRHRHALSMPRQHSATPSQPAGMSLGFLESQRCLRIGSYSKSFSTEATVPHILYIHSGKSVWDWASKFEPLPQNETTLQLNPPEQRGPCAARHWEGSL